MKEIKDEYFLMNLRIMGNLSKEDHRKEIAQMIKEEETGIFVGFSDAYLAEYKKIKDQKLTPIR